MADASNERGPAILTHASEVIGRGARDARVFFCFMVAGMVPSMSLFLHVVLSTYSMVLAHLRPNALLALAIFQHLCEVYLGVRTLVALFRVFFETRLDASGAIFGCQTFRLHPSMVTRFIPMPNKDWEEWWANWCFMRFAEEDGPVAYFEPMGASEALPA
jgi:hypothetical protein